LAEQESQRRRTLDERQATINAARTTAQTGLQEAKKALPRMSRAARVELEHSSGSLANEIAEAILAAALPGPAAPGQGGAMKSFRRFLVFTSGGLLMLFFMRFPCLPRRAQSPITRRFDRRLDFSLA